MKFFCIINFTKITFTIYLCCFSFVSGGENTGEPKRLEDYIVSGNRDIILPRGKFTVGPQTITLPENTRLSGQGKDTVIVAQKNTGIALKLQSDCSLKNVTFYAPEAENKKGNTSAGLIYVSGRNIHISGVRMRDIPRAGIVSANADNLTIKNCCFENIGTAINLQFTNNSLVENNYVLNASKHGIQFWGNWKWEDIKCTNLRFIRNTVINGGDGAIWGSGGKRIMMSENIIDGAHDVGLDLEWCHDSVISSNIVRRARNGGIALFFSCENVSITGNSIVNDLPISEKDANARWWVRSGIWLTYENTKVFKNDEGHKNIIISGNSITCAKGERRGMWIGGGQNVLIGYNVLRGGKVWYGGKDGESQTTLRSVSIPTTLNPVELPQIAIPASPKIHDNNHIINGNFSKGMAGWNWNAGKSEAVGKVTNDGPHDSPTFLLSNFKPFEPNVYSMLFQRIKNLKPSTKYRVSFVCKGENAKGIWFGGGKNWAIRNKAPGGTFKWTDCQAIIETGPEENSFEFMIVSEDVTDNFWVRNIRFIEE